MTLTLERSLEDEFAAWLASDPRIVRDPYPFFARLRREAPVYRDGDLMVLSRYADCQAVALDGDLWKTDGKRYDYGGLDPAALPQAQRDKLAELFQMERLALNKTEGAQHDRIRMLVQRAFTPKTVEGLAAPLQAIADQLLDEAPGDGVLNAIDDFAFQLPLIMICTLLEVPIADRRKIREISQGISGLFAGVRDDVVRVVDDAHRSRLELFAYLRGVIARRKREGGDPDSVMSILLSAEAGDRLSEEELLANAVLFVFAGHETTTNAIGNALVALMQNRDQWRRLADDPSLARSAADECLRFISPVQTEPRVAMRDTEVGGIPMAQGQRVRMVWASANRDPERFPQPDRFDITRTDNRHLALGVGRHHCLGASLARLEIATAIGTLARRYPQMRMAGDEPDWRLSFNVRAVHELPLVLGPESR
jgi:cytochrome P450